MKSEPNKYDPASAYNLAALTQATLVEHMKNDKQAFDGINFKLNRIEKVIYSWTGAITLLVLLLHLGVINVGALSQKVISSADAAAVHK